MSCHVNLCVAVLRAYCGFNFKSCESFYDSKKTKQKKQGMLPPRALPLVSLKNHNNKSFLLFLRHSKHKK